MGWIPRELKQHAETALSVTRLLKNVLQSPVADIIVAIIPTDIDDEIRNKIVSALDKFGRTNIENIPHSAEHIQKAILIKIASIILSELDDNNLKESTYDLVVQATYSNAKI